MITAAVDTFGELNVIFNNAGMNRPRGFMDVDEANFEQIVRVNTWGVIVCTQEAARQMIAQGPAGRSSTPVRSRAGRGSGTSSRTAWRSSALSRLHRRLRAA